MISKEKKAKMAKWLVIFFGGLFSLTVLAALWMQNFPDVKVLGGCLKTKMYSVWLCPNADTYVKLENISPFAVDAVIVSEDGGFYSHQGFDWFEIQKTIEKNLSKFSYSRGGSTITQQLAKNVFLTGEKSLWRKFREAYLTAMIEKKYTKRFILERYLNVIEFGPKIYGIKTAARHYFNKSPIELNLIESAFLAFLLPNPKIYSKSFTVKSLTPFARKRIVEIVRRLTKYNKVTLGEANEVLVQLGRSAWINSPPDTEETSLEDEADDDAVTDEQPASAPSTRESQPAESGDEVQPEEEGGVILEQKTDDSSVEGGESI